MSDDRQALIDKGWTINDDGPAGEGSGCLDPLPVRLISFEVYHRENTAILQWTSTMEKNFAGYIVSHSTDGKKWKEMEFVEAQSTDQLRMQKSTYDFIDKNPASGINYYRLKQMDKDGSYDYSGVRMLKFEDNGTVQLYPNPSSDRVTISGLEGVKTLQIRDMTGRIVKSINFDGTSTSIGISELNSGMYILQSIDALGQQETYKLMKE